MLFPTDLDPEDPSYAFWMERLAVFRRSLEIWLSGGNPWRPIETAPRELAVIICNDGSVMDIGSHTRGDGWWTSPDARFQDPKFWCPLPPHPLLIPRIRLTADRGPKSQRRK